MRKASLSYAAIGRRLNISHERARQIATDKPTPQKPDELMLTTNGVAQLLGVHPNTVRHWTNRGILKSYRIGPGGHRRFRPEDMDDFLNAGESVCRLGGSVAKPADLERVQLFKRWTMTLREATIKVLQDNHETMMSAESIASLINEKGLFHNPIDAPFLLFGIMNCLKDFQVLIELRKRRRRLTPREVEVMAYRCSGFTKAEIGETLGISPYTVSRESDNAFNKLGVDNLTRALRECLRQRYFTVNELPL